MRALSNKRRSIRLPHRKEEALKKIQKAYYTLSQIYLRKPTVAEVARETNIREEDVSALMSISNSVISLDSELSFDSGNLLDLYEDKTYDPDRD